MKYLYGWNSVSEFIYDELSESGYKLDGVIVDDQYHLSSPHTECLPIISSSKVKLSSNDQVINCLGYKNLSRRVEVGELLFSVGALQGFTSKHAKVHPTSIIGPGSILLGDVTIERKATIGKHCLLWGGSRICHDSNLGHGVFMASGSIIGGGCTIGHESTFGFNSSMREKSIMPNKTTVGANRFWHPDAALK